MAERASCDQVRRIHGEFADLYSARIAKARQSRTQLRAHLIAADEICAGCIVPEACGPAHRRRIASQTVADQFDDGAPRIDPLSERRTS